MSLSEEYAPKLSIIISTAEDDYDTQANSPIKKEG
jgi:hypothetical protein